METTGILESINHIAERRISHKNKASLLTELIKSAKGYRWVGLYDITKKEVINIAWTGPNAPSYPRFPVTKGLTGAVVAAGEAVNVGDVNADSRYLNALGTIQVESDKLNAFGRDEQRFLEECAQAIAPGWK